MVNQPGNVWFPGFLDGAESGFDFTDRFEYSTFYKICAYSMMVPIPDER
jgi:hypothetical protein